MSITARRRSVLAWHVHGSWMEAFVAGPHRSLLPVTPERAADGRGSAERDWPNIVEVPAEQLHDNDIDLVVLQRPMDIELAERRRHFLADQSAAHIAGKAARANAQNRFGLDRFISDWEDLVETVCH